MSFFVPVEGECAVIVENGVYRQVDLYTRDGYLYAKAKGGFIRLSKDGGTSSPRVRLETISWEAALFSDPMGRLCTTQVPRAIAIQGELATKLLGGPSE